MALKLLDLFCCAGGAGEGYRRAGFDVTGVDIAPQKNNPHRFIQADALEYLREHGRDFDAIHASPPCQAFSTITPKRFRNNHPDLIAPVRELLKSIDKPYVIENVGGARMKLVNPFMLCGTMFGLRTPCGAELQRHRYFEASWFVITPECRHGVATRIIANIGGGMCKESRLRNAVIRICGTAPRDSRVEWMRRKVITVTGATAQQNVVRNELRETFSVADARVAMGIDWMIMKELSQAIPPAYTEWIGNRLTQAILTNGLQSDAATLHRKAL